MNDRLFSQEEIDALLSTGDKPPIKSVPPLAAKGETVLTAKIRNAMGKAPKKAILASGALAGAGLGALAKYRSGVAKSNNKKLMAGVAAAGLLGAALGRISDDK